MDVDALKSGAFYSELKDSHVIFICLNDIFHQKLPVYTFENLCRENYEIALNDRTWKHFFIVPECAKMFKSPAEKAFFNFIMKNSADDTFTERLQKSVEDARHNLEWRRQYMDWERSMNYKFREGLERGLEQGLEQGRELQKLENAVVVVKKYKIPIEEVASDMNIPVEKLQQALIEA